MSIALEQKITFPCHGKIIWWLPVIRLYCLIGKSIQNFGDDLLVWGAFLADFFENKAFYSDTCPVNQIWRADIQRLTDGKESKKARSRFSVLDVWKVIVRNVNHLRQLFLRDIWRSSTIADSFSEFFQIIVYIFIVDIHQLVTPLYSVILSFCYT